MAEQLQKQIHKDEIIFKCPYDGTVLWIEFNNGAQIRGDSCSHYVWEAIGNGCYPDELDPQICSGTHEIVEKSIMKLDQGMTIWFLVPMQ